MSKFDASTLLNSYQYPRWPTPISRPQSSLPSKNINEMFTLGIENRNHTDFSSKSRLNRHNIYIPTDSRVLSPPLLYQPTSTPDLCSAVDQNSVVSSTSPSPTPIKSSAFNIPIKNRSGENSLKNFPKQTHERRKITQERKRQKQLALKHAHADADHWFQLRQSLAELKRLATTDEILIDPTTSLFNCDGYSFDALKQAIREQQEQKKFTRFKSESGLSTSMDTLRSFNIRSRTSLTTSRNSFSRPQLPRQSTETYVRPTFEPLLVASKPLHPLLLTGNTHSTKIKPRPQSRTRLSREEKRVLCTSSNLSNNEDIPISFTPSPTLQDTKEDQPEPIKLPQITFPSDQPRPSIKSAIKLKSSVPRCRSANDAKQNLPFNKNYPRFILITDQEHRIESWYHQYPFIVSDELIQTFQTKPNKTTVSAYFIDEHQPQPQPTKTHLQGKPFHINNDWKKYDLIFISNNIYHDIIIYLQTIIKLSGKLIHIYQINHNEDLKTQVRFISKQLNQQVTSHV